GRDQYHAEPRRAAVTPDGRLLALAARSLGAPHPDRLVLWDLAKGRPAHTKAPPATDGPPLDVAVSADGRVVATAGAKGVELWGVGGADPEKTGRVAVTDASAVAF